MTVHKDNPFLFDFIVDVGQDHLAGEQLKNEGQKLIKYFLASLAIPDRDLWVNLSPYEKNRMIPEALGQTDMGRDLLEQDYILKQITASLIYPEKQLGKTFWDKVYAKAQEMYGTTQVPVNTFNKVWIMADKAEVFEHNQTAFVVDCHLKVMLEEDYLALSKHQSQPGDMFNKEQQKNVSPSTLPSEVGLNAKAPQGNNPNALASQIVRSIILPELEKEVNTGKNFANLRQIFNSVILSSWYKKNLKEALLNQVYANKSRVKGIERLHVIPAGSAVIPAKAGIQKNGSPIKTFGDDIDDINVIYEQYLKAYKKGVFNYIKEDVNNAGATIPRKYFSGGTVLAVNPTKNDNPVALDNSMTGNPLVDFATLASTQQPSNPNAAMSTDEVIIELKKSDHYSSPFFGEDIWNIVRDYLNGKINEKIAVEQIGYPDKLFIEDMLKLAKSRKVGMLYINEKFAIKESDAAMIGHLPLKNKTILLVCPDTFPSSRDEVTESLSKAGAKVIVVSGSPEALPQSSKSKFNLIIVDNDMHFSELELRRLKEINPGAKVAVWNLLNGKADRVLRMVIEQLVPAIRPTDGRIIAVLENIQAAVKKVNSALNVEEVEAIANQPQFKNSADVQKAKEERLEALRRSDNTMNSEDRAQLTARAKEFVKSFDSFKKNVPVKDIERMAFSWVKKDMELDWPDLKSVLSTRDQRHRIARQAVLYLLRHRAPVIRNLIRNDLEDVWSTLDQKASESTERNRGVRLDSYLTMADLNIKRAIPYLIRGMNTGVETLYFVRRKITEYITGHIKEFDKKPDVRMAWLNAKNEVAKVNAEAASAIETLNLRNGSTASKKDSDEAMKSGDGKSNPAVTAEEEWDALVQLTKPSKEINPSVRLRSYLKLAEKDINNAIPRLIEGLSSKLESGTVKTGIIRYIQANAKKFVGDKKLIAAMMNASLETFNPDNVTALLKSNKSDSDDAAMGTKVPSFKYNERTKALPPGGIDLNTSNGMQWKVSKDGHGVEMNVDPAMIERIRREGINWLSPVIFKMTPVTSIWPLVGLRAPAPHTNVAGV